jgi:hypothetical protein
MATAKVQKGKKRSKRKTAGQQQQDNEQAGIKVFDNLMAEKKPMVPATFLEEVEEGITGSGSAAVYRRIALAYLSKPFPETAKGIASDKKTARAFAEVSVQLGDVVKQYQSLVDLLKAADTRLMLALCQREDMKQLLAEARNGAAA